MNSRSPGSGKIPQAIRLAAANWRCRQDAGLDPVGEAAFNAWLNADPRHAVAYDEISGTWSNLVRLRVTAAADGDPDPDLLAPAKILTI